VLEGTKSNRTIDPSFFIASRSMRTNFEARNVRSSREIAIVLDQAVCSGITPAKPYPFEEM
jgi:hypothetical protein